MAVSPDISEYFLAGRNDGGALMEESARIKWGSVNSGCVFNRIYCLHVTAESLHCNVLSVARICFSDFHVRFLFPPAGLLAKEIFLKTGNGESMFVYVYNRNVKN